MGWAWFDALGSSGHLQGLERSAGMLTGLLDELIKGDPARAAATTLGGFSQGAIMTLEVGFRYRPQLGGLVAMSGYLMDEARSFEGLPDGDAPPVCMVHGLHDDVIAVERGRKARAILEKHGVKTSYAEFEMGHGITDESWAFVNAFLEARL